MRRFLYKFNLLLLGGTMLFSACNPDNGSDPQPDGSELHTVAWASGSGSNSFTYVQGLTSSALAEGEITFDGRGFQVPSTRTARVFASGDGNSLFSLDYGGGVVYKFNVLGGSNYNQITQTDVSVRMGTDYPRWTKVSEDYAMVHNVTTDRIYDEVTKEFIKTVSKATLLSVNLQGLDMNTNSTFEIPEGIEAQTGSYDHVFRIDAPIVVGDKAYYGMGKAGFDPTNPDERKAATYSNVETLVVDFPSLKNPRIISSDKTKGATNGYRTPVAHQDENGDVYQLVTVNENSNDTYILQISNGDYTSYGFNLSQHLGPIISNGWFYVGNGIGYVPYTTGKTSDNTWGVARVDIYNQTVVDLNLPDNLWLQQYQRGVMIDGKFHMAIAPVGGEGHIYMFDPQSTSPDGFEKGAKLVSGADSYYIGIY